MRYPKALAIILGYTLANRLHWAVMNKYGYGWAYWLTLVLCLPFFVVILNALERKPIT